MSAGGRHRRTGDRLPRALLAAAASAVVPGLGQLLAHRPRRAVPFLLLSALNLAVVGAAWWLGPVRVVELLVQPRWVQAAIAACLVSLVVRVAAAADAYHCVRPWLARPVRWSLVGIAAVVAIAAVVVVPHVVLIRDAAAQQRLLSEVFTEQVAAPVAPGPAPQRPRASASTRPEPTASPSPSPPPSPQAPTFAATGRDGRWTVLLLGSDAGPDRWGARTDTMVVLTIDPVEHTGVMIGIPRNLARVPFPPGPLRTRFPAGFTDIANAVYGYGAAHPELFPGVKDSGATAVEHAAAAITGLEIDNWAMVDLRGIVGVVDALGGLTLDVPTPLHDRLSPYREGGPWVEADIPAGRQHLSADEVYVYIRSRHADSDYLRMSRQRCALEAMGQELTGPGLVTKYADLARAIVPHVTTDIARGRLPDLVRLGAQISPGRIGTLLLVPPVVDTAAPDYPRIRDLVQRVVKGHFPAGTYSSPRLTSACHQ